MEIIKHFFRGAKMHPGNFTYICLVFALYGAALQNDNLKAGIIAASVFTSVLMVLYFFTSVSVSKANTEVD